MAVTQPFKSPIFESRLQPGLHPHAIKTIFFEVISTVMKHEFMDVNLPSTPGRTYGHVIEDIEALILVANCGFCIPAPKPNDPITEDILLVLAQTILQYEKMHAAAVGNVPSPQELSAEKNAPPIVPSDTNAARLAAWVAKNKNDYETNKNEGVIKFSSFPESYLQITTD
jgi:hypothetical protein